MRARALRARTELYEPNAKAGDAEAMFRLAIAIDEVDEVLAEDWMRRSAEAGYAPALLTVASRLDSVDSRPEDVKTAVALLTRAADAGESEGRYLLGRLLLEGRARAGVLQDRATALGHMRRAAECGHVEAQLELGKALSFESLRSEDEVEAARWFRAAAALGNPEANYLLARLYAAGTGVGKDEAEAVRLLRVSLSQIPRARAELEKILARRPDLR
jgi:TPR repeat protein